MNELQMSNKMKKGSMRNVLSTVDPTTQQGSLAGTMAPGSPAPATTAPSMNQPAANTQPQVSGQQNQYEANDEHEPLSEDDWYQLLHNLGSAMHRANPDIQKVLGDMSPQIDYGAESEKLRQSIANRKTTQAPGELQQVFASVNNPEAAQVVQGRVEQAKKEAAQKQSDLSDLQENITLNHIQDLQKKGKFQEALATMLLQKGITEAGSREKQNTELQMQKLKGQNALQAVQARAKAVADTFHFDERMRLKLLDIAGRVANDKLQKYGGLDPVTGGFSIKPEQYDQWTDETMAEIYRQAASLKGTGVTPNVPGKTPVPSTNHGKATGTKADPLGLR